MDSFDVSISALENQKKKKINCMFLIQRNFEGFFISSVGFPSRQDFH